MAKLLSQENIGFTINLLTSMNARTEQDLNSNTLNHDALWLNYEIIIHANESNKVFNSRNARLSKQQNLAGFAPIEVELSSNTVGKFCFSLKPRNEVQALTKLLRGFIDNPSKQEIFFEPADPCFELRVERDKHMLSEEYRIYLWIDAGNSTRLQYSWDAEGIRFMVTKSQLEAFILDLESLSLG